MSDTRKSRSPLRKKAFGAVLASAVACILTTMTIQAVPGAAMTTTAAAKSPGVFAYYYLWWSASHWTTLLGRYYPLTASALPLPAAIGVGGCTTKNNYPGNILTDVPRRIYSQDDPGFIEADVRQAAAAGLTGFAVNWAGTGAANQDVNSNPYSRRLKMMIDAVHKVNREGIPFSLWLSYKASAIVLTQTQIDNDLGYFYASYGSDSAFDRTQSAKPTVIWQGSRKYPLSVLHHESSLYRSRMRILGDESTWSTSRAPYLDGDAYYWSSQNPYKNPQSFTPVSYTHLTLPT